MIKLKEEQYVQIKSLIETQEFRAYIKDLAYFADQYVEEVKTKLLINAITNYENETIVKLLAEYHKRKEMEMEENYNDFLTILEYSKTEKINFSNYCLTHSKSYRETLYDMLVK